MFINRERAIEGELERKHENSRMARIARQRREKDLLVVWHNVEMGAKRSIERNRGGSGCFM